MSKNEVSWLVQSSALARTLDWACSRGLDPLAGLCLCPFSLGLVFLLSHIWTYKMDINDTIAISFHLSWTLIVSGY